MLVSKYPELQGQVDVVNVVLLFVDEQLVQVVAVVKHVVHV